MAVTRLRGDWLAARFGPQTVVFLAGATALVGSLIIVTIPLAWASILGFGILGMGLAVVFPTIISVISHHQAQPAVAVSAISTVGYVGFLAGPPLIGYLAQATSLPTAMLIPVACGLVITVFSRALPRRLSSGPH